MVRSRMWSFALLVLLSAALLLLPSVPLHSSPHDLSLVIDGKPCSAFRVVDGSIYIRQEEALPYSTGPVPEHFLESFDGAEYVHARNFFTSLGYLVQWDEQARTASIGRETPVLPPLTAAKLRAVLQQSKALYPLPGFRSDIIWEEPPLMEQAEGAEKMEPTPRDEFAAAPDGDLDYSGTNIQVAGVDEADIVKTDGRYLYQLTGKGTLVISKIFPPGQLQVVARRDFPRQTFRPVDLYLHDNLLLVIGSSWKDEPPPPPRAPFFRDSVSEPLPETAPEQLPEPFPARPPYYPGQEFAKACLLEFNGTTIETVREVEIEGSYLSSRKIDSFIYLLSSMHVYDIQVPHFRDSLFTGEKAEALEFDRIGCLPGCLLPSYVNIVSLDLEDSAQQARVASYLGAGREVYMSRENIYLATNPHYAETEVYRFAVRGTGVSYEARGRVQGNLLNQFSMDEHEGFFRIATTSREKGILSNNLFVLNRDMEVVSALTEIAPTERIYAVRFMGERAYMVTFEIIDPFFVIDLSDPFKPRILGELKIPGFSTYLHPVGENHILGIGRDVQVLEHRDSQGHVIGQPFGVEKGLKLSLFDISDLENPLEKHQVILGTEGTFSEALHNHKAVLFDPRNNLLALPVYLSYAHKFNDQGAYVYRVDLEDGFRLLGSESHLGARGEAGQDAFIKRTLYVQDYLYFVSDARISARTVDEFSTVAAIDLAGSE